MKHILLKSGINSTEFVLLDALVIPDENVIKAGFVWGREVLRDQIYPLFDLEDTPKYSVKIPSIMQQLKAPALFNHAETELIFPLVLIGETYDQRTEIGSLDPSFEQSTTDSNLGNRSYRRTIDGSGANSDHREASSRDCRKRRQIIPDTPPTI